MIRKKDVIVIIAALLVAAVSYGGMVLYRQSQSLGGMVEVHVNGTLYEAVPLGETREVTVVQENGEVNIVAVSENGVHMAYSTCKNQLCLQQGEVTEENWTGRSMGRAIVCLPNRVLIELTLSDSAERIAEEDLPDV